MELLTLVSLYGDKVPEFAQLITECQSVVAEVLKEDFEPYEIAQVHATLIGLEEKKKAPLVNDNFSKSRGREEKMISRACFITCGTLAIFRCMCSSAVSRTETFHSRAARQHPTKGRSPFRRTKLL